MPLDGGDAAHGASQEQLTRKAFLLSLAATSQASPQGVRAINVDGSPAGGPDIARGVRQGPQVARRCVPSAIGFRDVLPPKHKPPSMRRALYLVSALALCVPCALEASRPPDEPEGSRCFGRGEVMWQQLAQPADAPWPGPRFVPPCRPACRTRWARLLRGVYGASP
jgi:hypothetical protein